MFTLCMLRTLTVIKQECVRTTHCYVLPWTSKVFAVSLYSNYLLLLNSTFTLHFWYREFETEFCIP